jgi:hypothetical protein
VAFRDAMIRTETTVIELQNRCTATVLTRPICRRDYLNMALVLVTHLRQLNDIERQADLSACIDVKGVFWGIGNPPAAAAGMKGG